MQAFQNANGTTGVVGGEGTGAYADARDGMGGCPAGSAAGERAAQACDPDGQERTAHPIGDPAQVPVVWPVSDVALRTPLDALFAEHRLCCRQIAELAQAVQSNPCVSYFLEGWLMRRKPGARSTPAIGSAPSSGSMFWTSYQRPNAMNGRT